jgi:hypothetical protein
VPLVTLDLRRELPQLYSAPRTPVLLEVPELGYLQIDGHGDPNTAAAYAEAVEALYAVAYTIRFALKRGPEGVDAAVMPLEGLWWTPDMTRFSTDDKSAWDWTLMIRVPDLVDAELVDQARSTAAGKKPRPALDRVRWATYTEGPAAHVLHVGPYSAEGPTVERLHRFIADAGFALTGKHHEIYLGDPRRAAPERLRTIIRQPVVPA